MVSKSFLESHRRPDEKRIREIDDNTNGFYLYGILQQHHKQGAKTGIVTSKSLILNGYRHMNLKTQGLIGFGDLFWIPGVI